MVLPFIISMIISMNYKRAFYIILRHLTRASHRDVNGCRRVAYGLNVLVQYHPAQPWRWLSAEVIRTGGLDLLHHFCLDDPKKYLGYWWLRHHCRISQSWSCDTILVHVLIVFNASRQSRSLGRLWCSVFIGVLASSNWRIVASSRESFVSFASCWLRELRFCFRI